jgi:hypothetical protein
VRSLADKPCGFKQYFCLRVLSFGAGWAILAVLWHLAHGFAVGRVLSEAIRLRKAFTDKTYRLCTVCTGSAAGEGTAMTFTAAPYCLLTATRHASAGTGTTLPQAQAVAPRSDRTTPRWLLQVPPPRNPPPTTTHTRAHSCWLCLHSATHNRTTLPELLPLLLAAVRVTAVIDRRAAVLCRCNHWQRHGACPCAAARLCSSRDPEVQHCAGRLRHPHPVSSRHLPVHRAWGVAASLLAAGACLLLLLPLLLEPAWLVAAVARACRWW